MRARPNLSGDQLVQDYLARVAAAARQLPKGARMAFVGRTKAQIERQVGASGMFDPGRVMEVLAALGEPEELVRAERMRIDSKWAKNRAGDGNGGAAVAPAPAAPRPLTSRWKPATRPLPQDALPGPADPPDGTTAGGTDATAPAPWPGDLDALMPPGSAAGEDGPVLKGSQTPLDSAWRLARAHRRETVAVALIGLGGFILPFPFWLAGALVAMFSRLWDGRDKAVAVGGPVLFVLIGSVVTALFIGDKQNVIMIYTHALHADTGPLIRFGCLLSAVYLAWRVERGPRVKIPPWKR